MAWLRAPGLQNPEVDEDVRWDPPPRIIWPKERNVTLFFCSEKKKSHIPLLWPDVTWGRVPLHILINLRNVRLRSNMGYLSGQNPQ